MANVESEPRDPLRFARAELDVLWTALAHANDSIIVYRLPEGDARAHIVYVNDATVRQSGFSREELVAGSTGIGPLTDPETVEALRQAMRRGEPMRARVALYRKDGSMYWGDVDGRPVSDAAGAITHWISIERDISDAVEREHALSVLLEASRRLFGTLDASALDAAFVDALGTVLGADAAIVPAADPLVAAALASDDAVAGSPGRFAVALRAPGRDPHGAVVTRATPHRSVDDRGILALLAQIYSSAARNAALFEEVHQQRGAVLELSRMKGDLISMLAHDLNNPLTAIRGFAEFLAEEHLDAGDARVATASIIRATERLVDLGKETLTLARLEDYALVPTRAALDYGAFLAEIAADVTPNALVSVDGDVTGTADPVLVRGLFENVIGNAVKYSPQGDAIAIQVRGEGDHVAIDVEDHGIGIPPDEIERVFERFARGSNARRTNVPGTGFGLYFARLVALRHGGSITVTSRLDAGTRVAVRLPRVPPFTTLPHVLVVERDEQAASYTEHVLRDAGYRVDVLYDTNTFERALAEEREVVAVIAEAAADAITAARRHGVRVVTLRQPYLARDLLRELQNAG